MKNDQKIRVLLNYFFYLKIFFHLICFIKLLPLHLIDQIHFHFVLFNFIILLGYYFIKFLYFLMIQTFFLKVKYSFILFILKEIWVIIFFQSLFFSLPNYLIFNSLDFLKFDSPPPPPKIQHSVQLYFIKLFLLYSFSLHHCLIFQFHYYLISLFFQHWKFLLHSLYQINFHPEDFIFFIFFNYLEPLHQMIFLKVLLNLLNLYFSLLHDLIMINFLSQCFNFVISFYFFFLHYQILKLVYP